uniref:Uncharacterized protein n=1 Tax=Meloidogyne enterolobii TaxID=390850 RepID=A0A6V7UG89_MELEN|nr:unnamed protein product [Meloidogyne enterolobii]
MVHTQRIEATWGILKTSLRHLQGTDKEMLPGCTEFGHLNFGHLNFGHHDFS